MENELTHYGVLGMKWGVRKKRNLVNRNLRIANKYKSEKQVAQEYRRRADELRKVDLSSKNASKTMDAINKGKTRPVTSVTKKEAPKKASTMTDAELRKVTERLNLENNYNLALANKQKLNGGKSFATQLRDNSVKQLSNEIPKFVINKVVLPNAEKAVSSIMASAADEAKKKK